MKCSALTDTRPSIVLSIIIAAVLVTLETSKAMAVL